MFFVNRAYHQYTQGYNFPVEPTLKDFLLPRYGSFSGAHPGFWPIWGNGATEGQLLTTLDFGPKLALYLNFPKILLIGPGKN